MRPNSSYYPPYHPNDTTCLAGISIPTQQALDSLLREIKCKRIFYAVKTGRQEYEKEMPEVELCVQYFCFRLFGWRNDKGVCIFNYSGKAI